MPLASRFGTCQNLITTGFWPAGRTTAGETSRWSEIVVGSAAWYCEVPLCGLLVAIAQVSPVPLWVQPLAPASKPYW